MTKFDIEQFLPHVFLFSSLGKKEIKAIAQTCSLKRYKKNCVLFSQGADAEAFYVIINGKVSIFRTSPTGNEQVIHINEDHDVVAEASIFDKAKYPASCKTLKESLMLRIPRKEFIALLLDNPQTSLKVMAAYSKRLRELVTMVEYLSLDDVKLRILKYFQRHMNKTGDKPTVNLKISKKELAHLLGTIPETLSRNLRRLKADGIITENRNLIQIEKLREFKKLLGSE